MAGDDGKPEAPANVVDSLQRRLRVVVAAVFVVLLVALVVLDSVGRLLIDPNFRTSDFIFGTIIGAILLLLGVEGLNKLPRIGNGK